MSASIIVPFRGDGAERTANWKWIRRHYEATYPEFEIVTGSTRRKEWSKGRAVNEAVARASHDVLVVADADVVLPFGALHRAIEALSEAPWVIPHKMVFRLNAKATEAVISGDIQVMPRHRKMMCRPPKLGPPGGGVSVLSRDAMDEVHGVDPRFEGWGGEDISFARALDTLVGPHRRMEEILWHLWHTPMERRPRQRASEKSEALAGRYLDANGDPVAMRDLCDEIPYEGVMGGGVTVTTKGVVADIPFDERFTGWG